MTIATTSDAAASTPKAEKGVAPIKAEYLISRTAESVLHTEENKETSAADSTDRKQGGPAKRQGGQHQNRKNKNKGKPTYDEPGTKLCGKIAQGETCPFDDKCSYSHDVAKYLAEKEPDLGPSCVNFDIYGHCRFGLRCRYADAHTRPEDHSQIVDEAKVKTVSQRYALNEVGRDLQIRLRKKEVRFPRTDEFTEMLKQEAASDADAADAAPPTGESPDEISDCDFSLKGQPQAKRHRAGRGHIDFRGKTYLAPLTTVGNLPFRRICKGFGVDITCSEMAIASNLLQGQQSEWALLKRHPSEDVFGVQLAGNRADVVARAAELVARECAVDFVDLNMGCPIDMAFNNGGGSALLAQPRKIGHMVRGLVHVTDCDVTAKIRTGVRADALVARELVPQLEGWGAAAVTVHGRTRQQRYTKLADWTYIAQCRQAAQRVPVFGGGDVMSWEEYWEHVGDAQQSDGVMIGRGALIKPWVFREISERRVWDISATERLDVLRDFARFGLEHWGTDPQGVSNTRRYLLEWQSFLHRYVPAGILEVLPQRMNDRPPAFVGRNDLETLMASDKVKDWVKLVEMVLGPTPENFTFVPKHKSNSYE
ncbi:tRNA-dihydrouridine(47) synthase [NAD(P)(+)]-like protein [Coemansia thaxteri]|uniref:tRNA-dihydrouridine(47) synthase [NAD(P)(+)] n=1 Tax=Coemansia thaxteri TaxID=2663907 RepID=A0A9W8EF08_9FUNG|nr:tRNA-dihydrouridine(47) synthase [NAD(P)(+)]-like protein [Coemansia thaxteri]KAJ2007360.1 tRNA-dihydrouridine(47) synthase [NAD(P)(+)]-like protein [Coemansia thaxteri]KAJ2469225.1 tRNA-dihydrouridine(47) synthase [NAD(P)(+)]-like protein [Coemansia sp. RSA 2322]KAJ2478566.1 tRNA-dihydrouridine(47) synthase [NAD(P)(+)]-like protein [Coemansia sp. RSA 2320]